MSINVKKEAKQEFLKIWATATAEALWEAIGPMVRSHEGSWEQAGKEVRDFLETFEPSSAYDSAASLNFLVENNIPVGGLDKDTLLKLKEATNAAWNTIQEWERSRQQK